MAIIVTYDVPTKHVELKKALFALGYTETIVNKDEARAAQTIYLPNTTVYHKSKNATEGISDVKNACANLNLKLERCITTQLGPDWMAIYGEPFK